MEKLILKYSQDNNIHIYIYKPKIEIKAVVQSIHGASGILPATGSFADLSYGQWIRRRRL